MERLNDIYNNTEYDDNTVIIRSLNTFINESNNDPTYIFNQIIYFMVLFEDLIKSSSIKRPNILYIIDIYNKIKNDETFDNVVKILKDQIKQDKSQYRNIWILCFLRSLIEIKFLNNILYKKPKYAINIALGNSPYNVFLDSLEDNDYFYENE